MLCTCRSLLPGWGSISVVFMPCQGTGQSWSAAVHARTCCLRRQAVKMTWKPHLLTTAQRATAQSPNKVRPGSASHLDTEGTS